MSCEDNKIVLEKVCAKIMSPINNDLQLPNNVEIHPNARLRYRKSGWPFIEHYTNYQMPLISKNVFKNKAMTVHLNSTDKTGSPATSCTDSPANWTN